MTLWRKTRTEMAGAWRSLQYDMNRPDPATGLPARHAVREEVTATGMSTFGGVTGLRTGPAQDRNRRRLVTVTALGTLVVAGAGGSYLAVTSGMGALAGGEPGAEPYPLAAAAPGAARSNQGLGRGSAPELPVASAEPGATLVREPLADTIQVIPNTAATTATPGMTTRATAPPRTRPTKVEGGTTPPAGPEPCDCLTPPVPTPTAAPTHQATTPPVPTPTESTSDTESPSAEPSDDPTSAEPDDGEGRRHDGRRARHARRD
ncbi:hypothetical protein [Symbioplanes lichenis]|uniref:hypothetical protein n=1 Tax=Symbioplanes lichenis TaxID=1629072 RepID=UPI00273946C2|nr:hypothetical protein [Actinoplanes lichenis]